MLLSQANIGHSLIETEYRGHAAELGNALVKSGHMWMAPESKIMSANKVRPMIFRNTMRLLQFLVMAYFMNFSMAS